MKKLYEGKTKDVFEKDGELYLRFKDDQTGADGKFDPGANEVIGQISGMGEKNLRISKYFFEKLSEKNIKNHYIGISDGLMRVKKAKPFGDGLEVITRYIATGSFIRRYGRYAEEGMDLSGYTEITLKDDQRGDPLILKEGLEILGLVNDREYDELIHLNSEISKIIKEELANMGLTLVDIKFEYGRVDGEVYLIDEISAGNMRVYRDGKKIDQEELSNIIIENI